MAKRPVWMIIAHFYPAVGGAERQVQRVSRLLIAEHDVQVTVLTRRHSDRLPDDLPACETIDGIPVMRLMSATILIDKLRSLSFMISCLWYLFRHGRGDNYHAHDEGTSAWIAVIARFLFGGRAIVKLRVGRTIYESYSPRRKRRLAWLLRHTDRVVAVSRDVEPMLAEWGVPAGKIAYVPNGVDTDDFRPADHPMDMRARLGLPDDQALALFVGRLHRDKGADLLFEAWGQLPEALRSRMHLVVVGGGAEAESLRMMTQTLQIESSVSMVGAKKHVRDYYQAADFLVQPARADGLSNTMLEAMACGLPVVIAGVAGALDFIESGHNGLYFDYGDSASLARTIGQMLAMQSRWQAMGNCARQTVVAKADLHRVAAAMSNLYL